MIIFPTLLYLIFFWKIDFYLFLFLFYFNFFRNIDLKYPIFLILSYFIDKIFAASFIAYIIYRTLVSYYEIYPFKIRIYSYPSIRILELEEISLILLILWLLI